MGNATPVLDDNGRVDLDIDGCTPSGTNDHIPKKKIRVHSSRFKNPLTGVDINFTNVMDPTPRAPSRRLIDEDEEAEDEDGFTGNNTDIHNGIVQQFVLQNGIQTFV